MGAIICGYPGIGKSTLCRTNPRFIDLESSCFYKNKWTNFANGEEIYAKCEDWYIGYVNLAIDLAKQGYLVCLSCHDVVRARLASICPKDIDVLVIMPGVEIKDVWLNRIRDRYYLSKDEKDKRALEHCEPALERDMEDAILSPLPLVLLRNPDYDLGEVITNALGIAIQGYGRSSEESKVVYDKIRR